jgi:hypothetical protein
MIIIAKKILSFSLILLMMFVTVGMQLHYHTCGKTGERTFQLVETPECSCEAEILSEPEASCCHIESDESNCHKPKNTISKINFPTIKNIDCCQDDLVNVGLDDIFVLSGNKNLFKIVINYQLFNFDIEHINLTKLSSLLSKIESASTLPQNIIVYILKVSHIFSRSDNSSDLH